MSALIGFVLGYLAGVQAGPAGTDELRRSFQAIVRSEEWKRLSAAASGLVDDVLGQGGAALVEALRALSANEGDGGETLRGVGGDGDPLSAWRKLADSPELRDLVSSGKALLDEVLARAMTVLEGAPDVAGHA